MQKLFLGVIGAGLLIGLLLPSEKPVAATPAQAAKAGLFEAPVYKKTELKRHYDGHFYVTANVNGAPITFLVDTGATRVALTQEDAKAAGLDFSPGEFEPVGQTANGIALGKLLTLPKVVIEGKEVMEVDAVILENSAISLLGQSYLSRLNGVQMNGDHMVLR